MINTLKPIISLTDKNYSDKTGLFNSDSLFSGELTLHFADLFSKLDASVDTALIAPFVVSVQYNEDDEIIIKRKKQKDK